VIIVYPMLSSSSISPSALPGICKALERYIIVYRIDQILETLRSRGVTVTLKGKGGQLFMKEQDIPDFFPEPRIKPDKEEEDRVKKAAVDIKQPDSKSLSAEPTFHIINTAAGPLPLGIKVVSYPVQSDVTLAAMLTDDRKMSFVLVRVTKLYRDVARVIFRAMSSFPFLKFGTVTTDPRRDIIMERTTFGKQVVACINYIDLQQDFFQKPGRINRLFALGWKDIIVADDVNKQAYFCLTTFKGMCTAVPYSFLYATVGKEDVFSSLEDVRRASGPLFRMKGKASKLFGESVAAFREASFLGGNVKMNLQKALDKIYLREQIPSTLSSFMKQITPLKMASITRNIEKAKDLETIKKILSFVPVLSLSKIESLCRKLEPNFDKSYALSKKVIQNSLPDLPEEPASIFACAIAFISSYKKDDPLKETKKNLKEFVSKVEDIMKKITVEWVIVRMIIAITIALTFWLTTTFAVLVATLPIETLIVLFVCATLIAWGLRWVGSE